MRAKPSKRPNHLFVMLPAPVAPPPGRYAPSMPCYSHSFHSVSTFIQFPTCSFSFLAVQICSHIFMYCVKVCVWNNPAEIDSVSNTVEPPRLSFTVHLLCSQMLLCSLQSLMTSEWSFRQAGFILTGLLSPHNWSQYVCEAGQSKN